MVEVAGQGCPTPGCQGIGHVRGPRYGTHYTLVGCPYSEVNLNRESSLQDRLSGERPSPSNSVQKPKRPETPAPFIDPQEDSPQSRKSSMQDSERSGRSSVHSLSEQSENSQEKDLMEEESSADTIARPKKHRICSAAGPPSVCLHALPVLQPDPPPPSLLGAALQAAAGGFGPHCQERGQMDRGRGG